MENTRVKMIKSGGCKTREPIVLTEQVIKILDKLARNG